MTDADLPAIEQKCRLFSQTPPSLAVPVFATFAPRHGRALRTWRADRLIQGRVGVVVCRPNVEKLCPASTSNQTRPPPANRTGCTV